MKNNEIGDRLEGLLKDLDSTTYNHSVRVMLLAVELEEYLSMTDHKLMSAALFHDLGKIYVPFKILDKSQSLTRLEREIIDLHPYIGYLLLSELGVDEDICRIVLYHHGVKPLTISDIGYYDNNDTYDKALMLHTIDAFEALTSDRPYHRGVHSKEALTIMSRDNRYHAETLQYLMFVSQKDDMGNSAVHRSRINQGPGFVKNLIMDMDL
jgi:putative nucleotidyltransferase with HDIG domain